MRHYPLNSHILVGLQIACIALVVYPFNDSFQSIAWLMVLLPGGLLGLYTLMHNRLGNFGVYPELVDNAKLVTTGPYRWIRHPMYLALLLIALSYALYNGSLWNLLGVVLLVPVLIGKMHTEENYLRKQYAGYADYVQRSKRLVPYVY